MASLVAFPMDSSQLVHSTLNRAPHVSCPRPVAAARRRVHALPAAEHLNGFCGVFGLYRSGYLRVCLLSIILRGPVVLKDGHTCWVLPVGLVWSCKKHFPRLANVLDSLERPSHASKAQSFFMLFPYLSGTSVVRWTVGTDFVSAARAKERPRTVLDREATIY